MQVRAGDGRVIAVEVAGDRDAKPVLLCHGLADSRLAAQWLAPAADKLGLCVIAPDRPGIGGSDPHRLDELSDWTGDAAAVLDGLGIQTAALVGTSGGGPYAAACAARMPGRVSGLMLIAALGLPEWSTDGMATGERLSLSLASRVPAFGGWSLGLLAALSRDRPQLFLRLAGTAQPDADIRALEQPEMRESFLRNYQEAFRSGSGGVAQDLRLLTRNWGFELASITVPTWVVHGDADTTVPVGHARRYAEAIPGARLQIYPGQGHFSILGRPAEVLAPLAE
jgi:pimeloyl-ACP methyl ester carboxylesterase